MIRYREILRLYSQGISKTAIAQSCECSRNTVSKVVQRAEEVGITQANIDQLRTGSKDPAQQRLLGTGDDLGKLLGLSKDWSYKAIKAVGNYGEIFERNVGKDSPLKIDRGINALWNAGGLLYAPPM